MLDASAKEYQILKNEVVGIKDCITKYVGYIIGSNGIAFLIFSSIKNNSNTDSTQSTHLINISDIIQPDIVLVAEIIIILSIYYIINYKFASHNRYVGYLQLLSQEIHHHKFENKKPIGESNIKINEKDSCRSVKDSDLPECLFAWEYVNSEWNNSINLNKYPEEHFNKVDFRLELPKGKSYNLNIENNFDFIPSDYENQNSIQLFLRNIIWEAFLPRTKESSKTSNRENKFIKFLKSIWWDWGMRFKMQEKYYEKFIITSWQYPKYIFALMTILLGFTYFVLFTYTVIEINEHLAKNKIGNLDWFLLFLVGLILVFTPFFWIYFYYDKQRLLKGDKTIDFYCWTFLSFRTRLLNNYGIRPIIHSLSFLRYRKALHKIEKALKHKIELDPDIKIDSTKISRGKRIVKDLFLGYKFKYEADKDYLEKILAKTNFS